MTGTVVAYVPVLHDGYRRLLEAHARGGRCFVPTRELYADYRPLAKDIRALEPELVVAALRGWEICDRVDVLDRESAAALAAERCDIVMPAEDVSYQLAEQLFPRAAIRFDSTFLRWDKTRTAQLFQPTPARTLTHDQSIQELVTAAHDLASLSRDWWRQVGAAMRLASGELIAAGNAHHPHELSAYAVGDPRSNFFRGVHLELSTATHAEARLIADAACAGLSTGGAEIYVTDFPCPPCARLIAHAGFRRLFFSHGYAVLDGQDVLQDAGVEIVEIVDAGC